MDESPGEYSRGDDCVVLCGSVVVSGIRLAYACY